MPAVSPGSSAPGLALHITGSGHPAAEERITRRARDLDLGWELTR